MAKLSLRQLIALRTRKTQSSYGWVYLAYSPRLKAYKIGVTTSLYHRMPQLRRKFRDPGISLVASTKSTQPYRLETALHNLYSGKALGREFFRLTLKDVQSLVLFLRKK